MKIINYTTNTGRIEACIMKISCLKPEFNAEYSEGGGRDRSTE